jgi:sulfur-carrier protein
VTVVVRIPGVLRGDAGGHASLEVTVGAQATLAQILDRIGAEWPLLERRIRDERGELRRFVNLYVDGEECRRLDGMGTAVSAQTEILVVPSVAGG